ncbi:MAG: hypothetical protein IKF14_14565 [Atopobiaceae bacterium]|nr:hypothetical protein [Atopobiaceae bacterium]
MHPRRKGNGVDAAQDASQGRLEVLMLSLLVAVLMIAGVLSLRSDPSDARGFEGLPVRVSIQRMAFVDYRQKLDNELLGNGVSYSSLGFERKNVIATDYAGRCDDCYVVSVERIGTDLTLRAQAVSEGSNWDALLRTPASRDYDHPSGLWALTVMQRNGRNATSEWVWFNDDGTGWRGEGGYDASSETLASLQEKSVPCTWHVAQVEGSQLVVLDYEGGQTIIKVTI